MERDTLICKLLQNAEYKSFKAGERKDFSYETAVAMYKIQVSDDEVTVKFKRFSKLTDDEMSEIRDCISLLADIALTE